MNKKRLLILTTSFPRYINDVSPSFSYPFAESMQSIYDVHVLAPHAKDAKYYEEMEGIKVFRFVYAPVRLEKFGLGIGIPILLKKSKLYYALIPLFMLGGFLKAIFLQRKYRYDVIHVNWLIPFGPFVGFLRVFSNFQYIITVHGSDVFPFVNKSGLFFSFFWWVHKNFTFSRADHIVCVSDALSRAISSLIPSPYLGKISKISMGIDFDKFFINKANQEFDPPCKIIFVGRLEEVKGVEYLIYASKILQEKKIDFQLDIYGDGSLRSKLESISSTYQLQQKVSFHGFVSHDTLVDKLAASDIFVGSSVQTSSGEAEGLGLVFLEAMAAGLVVIATSVGGIPEIVVDQKTGILVPEKNPQAIADAIERCIHDVSMRKKIIGNAQDFSKQYDWMQVVRQYELILNSKKIS